MASERGERIEEGGMRIGDGKKGNGYGKRIGDNVKGKRSGRWKMGKVEGRKECGGVGE